MKIAQIREAIRRSMWLRNDLTGGTSEEFRTQLVGPRLEEKIVELRALEIPARFAADIENRDEEIVRLQRVIDRWHARRAEAAPVHKEAPQRWYQSSPCTCETMGTSQCRARLHLIGVEIRRM